jgi:hypothetical protein
MRFWVSRIGSIPDGPGANSQHPFYDGLRSRVTDPSAQQPEKENTHYRDHPLKKEKRLKRVALPGHCSVHFHTEDIACTGRSVSAYGPWHS